MRFTVQLVSRVPIFADLVIEARTTTEAWSKAEALMKTGADADEATLRGLTWTHGEGAEHPVTFRLDDRDLDAIEVQGVLALEEEGSA